MINKFAHDVALQMGLKLSDIQLIKGDRISCEEAHLIHMHSNGHMVSAIVYVTEYDEVMSGQVCDALELRIMSAMSRLKMMLEP